MKTLISVSVLLLTSLLAIYADTATAASANTYTSKSVRIYNPNDRVYLSGTLTKPDNDRMCPLIILIAGSGRADRDVKINNFRPFYELAYFLTETGYAVFRYDKRGVGKSTGSYYNATTLSFANDAESIIEYFRKDTVFSKNPIGLLGHSEGGIIASMLSAKHPESIAFLILGAAPGVSGKALLLKQAEVAYKNQGLPEDVSIKWNTALEKVYEIAIHEKNSKLAKKMIEKILIESDFPKEGRKDFINNTVHPWLTGTLNWNPKEYLENVLCPVLAINGTKDVKVDSKDNLHEIENALKNGRCKEYKIVELPGIDHFFLDVKTQGMDKSKNMSNSISKEFLDTIAAWLKDHAGKQ